MTDPEAFDLATTAGAIEFIIRYVHDTWNCPIVFYSGAHFGGDGVRKSANPSEADYGTFIDLTKAAAEKWNAQGGYDVSVLDLFNDAEFNELVSDEDYTYLMRDPVHPRKAGYLVWWLPAFEAFLEKKV
ncbi:MAG: hypothetical protein IJ773_11680 [Lachnospiraceae bacterium]|nr:hypothetical protein [Lachnospiraceae bacterium]